MSVPRLPRLCADRPPAVRWKKTILVHCLSALLCLHYCLASAIELNALDVANADINSSDFVAAYYALYHQQQANASAVLAPVNIRSIELPDEITDRLKNASLGFEDLPALMQRALLWDSGYSINDDDNSTSVARIYTLCGTSMANLALSPTQLTFSSCMIETCPAANMIAAWAFALQCEASQLYSAATCACTPVVEQSAVASQDSVLWSNSTLESAFTGSSAVPKIRIRRHESVTVNGTTHVFAIHTSDRMDSCASASSPPFVIPCVPFNEDDPRWCSPSTSALMTQWIQEYALEVSSSIFDSSTAIASSSSGISSAASTTEDSENVVVNPDFVYNGESSDLSQQFYRRHLAGDDSQLSKIDFNGQAIPTEIQHRLAEVSLSFDSLSPLLQRALLWDSGYSFDESDSSLVTIYTQCGLSMADLAVPSTYFRAANCSLDVCLDSDANESFSRVQRGCDGDAIVRLSRCATTDLSASASGSVWATGGQAESVPVVTVKRHYWTSGNQTTTLLYGVHTVQTDTTTAVADCPAHGSMIIPCVAYSSIAPTASWCRPTAGALVTSWLRVAAKQQQFSLFYLIPILICAALAVVGVALCIRLRPWEQVAAKDDGGRNTMTTAAGPDGYLNAGGMFSCSRHSMLSMDGFLSSSPPALSFASSGSSIHSPDTTAATTPTSILHSLMNNPMLFHRHIPFHELQTQHLLSKGTHKEVWFSLYRGQAVAVKRLVKATHKQSHFELLESLAHEISVLVNLRHANIVTFVGVSWNSANNLCLVTEYVANGELLHYLRAQAQSGILTWQTAVIKLKIALGIAQALRYLHHVRNQAVLHGNLTSRHVLVSAELDAKLIDFGNSQGLNDRHRRPRSDSQPNQLPECSEALYWTAPEVLAGQKYSPSAAIYSFGVVLAELDTHEAPFENTLGQSPVEILQQVACGDLQPSVSASCPPEILKLMQSCLAIDPAARPTADAIVSILKAMAAAR